MNLPRLSLLVLPLLLLLVSGLGLGCFSETNDDLTIVALLRGVSAAAPVENLHLYFHGYAVVLSQLYSAYPLVPWYALTLYGLLYAATVLTFAVLEQVLRPQLSLGQRLIFLVLFFAVAWLEHGFWFNYVRVPLLLAGAGILFAAQRAPARWALLVGLLAFALAWLIRPSAAVLGLIAALPGAWWLARRQALPVVGGAVAWAMLGALWLNLTWTPEEARFRRLDVLKSNINDYQLYHQQPRTSTDSLGLAEVRHWMLGDSSLVNAALFTRAAPLDIPYFLQQTAPEKLLVLLQQLGRDYFPVLLALLAVAYHVRRQPGLQYRHEFWFVQLAFAGLLLALGVVLKLPPRLALPLLNFWLLANLIYVGQQTRGALGQVWGVLGVVLVLAAGPYAYKTWHRRTMLGQERRTNEALRRELLRPAGVAGLLVSDAVELTYKSSSPFADPVFGSPVQVLSLMGWQTLDPSQPVFRQQLTGTRNFSLALRQLATRANVSWMLTEQGAGLLNRHLQLADSTASASLKFMPKPLQTSQVSEVMEYVVKVK
ncbi:hypothetical protein [Hymenobacter wooponensis]|uniref:Glycosyltransferase RgtA/B/C/D-like domain-containing protein n=1 Tax=Hymenobacter wooponensis TaxID=1525360 RepID=A0A4Z0MM51_9BACT|nr:hypothetical protein [Hymenobacter wooponensis]TGD80631.1 hypothetical protein EU557_12450 [Hymenobacter wooponensis]